MNTYDANSAKAGDLKALAVELLDTFGEELLDQMLLEQQGRDMPALAEQETGNVARDALLRLRRLLKTPQVSAKAA